MTIPSTRLTRDMHAKMSTLFLGADSRLTANGHSPRVRDRTIVFATVVLADDMLGFAPNRALGAWCARTMSKRRLCSLFRPASRARTPRTPHIKSISALSHGASMDASTRYEGDVLIVHDRADETSTSRSHIIYYSSSRR